MKIIILQRTFFTYISHSLWCRLSYVEIIQWVDSRSTFYWNTINLFTREFADGNHIESYGLFINKSQCQILNYYRFQNVASVWGAIIANNIRRDCINYSVLCLPEHICFCINPQPLTISLWWRRSGSMSLWISTLYTASDHIWAASDMVRIL